MFSSFFKVALRVFVRDRVHTLINIFGLALGLTFSIIIFLYVHKEISYDRFHKNADRIYRVAVNGRIADNIFNHAVTAAPLSAAIAREIPDIESTVRVARFGAWLMRYGNARFNEDHVIFADANFFEFFSFPLIKGSMGEVLGKPRSIVLSEDAAFRYFGEEDPMGKMLRIENDSTYYRVTGIMENIPENSHMHFDMVGPLSTFKKFIGDDRWISHYLYTYVTVREGAAMEPIHAGLQSIVGSHVAPDYKEILDMDEGRAFTEGDYYHYIMQPLTAIHLRSEYTAEFEPVGKILYIYLLTAFAAIILILSCMNFIGLVTALSFNRAKEVGIRKIAGSEKHVLMRQFLVESSLLAFFAMALALFFTELALPAISQFIGLQLSLSQLFNSAGLILMAALILVIGIVSGLYPAWHQSSYQPVAVLRNPYNNHNGKGRFRVGLVLFQLFLAVGAIAMTLIITLQFRYLVHKDRGYDTENLLVIRRPDALTNKLEQYKEQISQHPGVVSVTNTTSAMGGSFTRHPFFPEDNPPSHNISFSELLVSFGFDTTYGIQMSSGRFFNRHEPGDSIACIINETAVKQMGITDPVGKTLIQLTDKPGKRFKFKIIGVVSDFHFETLDNPIRPLIMLLMPGNFEGYLTVRMTPENQDSTIKHLKTVWEDYTTAYPFVCYFLDKDKQERYLPVRTTARIFTLLSLVTLLMAGLGLFSLVSFSYNRNQREIGIQKVIGASNTRIIISKMSQIVWLVLIASLGAWIGVYFLAKAWFSDYAYHISLHVLYFILSTMVVALFSIATISYYTFMAARTNPGRALKYE